MTTPTSRRDAHAYAYAQPHGHTPPAAGSRLQTMRGLACLLHLLLLQLVLLLLLLQCKMLNGPKGPEQRTRQQQLMKGQGAGAEGRGAQQPRPAFCKFTIMIITSQRFFLVLQLSEGWMREM